MGSPVPMRAPSVPVFFAVLLAIPGALPAQDRSLLFAEAAAAKVRPAPSVRGDDPEWYFPVKEVKHLATGRFWEKPWEEVAANQTDPLPGIVEFHGLLKERGIRLLVVPVPAKASIYPETLVSGFQASEVAALTPFFQRLTEAGVEVLDLEPVFLQTRAARPDQLLYCRQDAHFSPAAAEIIAALVARQVPFTAAAGPAPYALGEPVLLTFTGDQITGSEWEGSVAPETQPLRQVSQGGVVGVAPDPASPVLLLGDSHTLVFHEGAEAGMHCAGAGVLDHLALQYGFAPDLVGVRGSGLVQARKQLFYKAAAAPGYWDNKKLVVWLFSAREFTQSTDKPVAIPLTR
jgi:alginate O-acetyltransferase complex protein AlgJ